VAQRHNLARLTRHGELIAQARPPSLRVGIAAVPLPAGAFLQATAQGEAVLSDLFVDACTGANLVTDLFAGIGPFALRLAAHARIFAFDNDEAAIAALRRGSTGTSGIKPVEAERRDLFKAPLSAAEFNRFDAVVFDPSRQGAQVQSREIVASSVPIVVAVSCNPGTFARDIRRLIDGVYRLLSVTPVDQFRYSVHVEIVARLAKVAPARRLLFMLLQAPFDAVTEMKLKLANDWHLMHLGSFLTARPCASGATSHNTSERDALPQAPFRSTGFEFVES
jgi:23S rRNA (uracil1939-C5)-methyltransferase